jgi:hypothetical protein
MLEQIQKLLIYMNKDIKQTKEDLDNSYGDELYESAVNARLNVLQQYYWKLSNIINEHQC